MSTSIITKTKNTFNNISNFSKKALHEATCFMGLVGAVLVVLAWLTLFTHATMVASILAPFLGLISMVLVFKGVYNAKHQVVAIAMLLVTVACFAWRNADSLCQVIDAV